MSALATRAALAEPVAATLVIDLATETVTVAGQVEPLPRKFFQLLRALARRPTQVCRKDDLLAEIWGFDGADAWRQTRTLDTHACRLRKVLLPAGQFVVGEWGQGYRLVNPGSEHKVSVLGLVEADDRLEAAIARAEQAMAELDEALTVARGEHARRARRLP